MALSPLSLVTARSFNPYPLQLRTTPHSSVKFTSPHNPNSRQASRICIVSYTNPSRNLIVRSELNGGSAPQGSHGNGAASFDALRNLIVRAELNGGSAPQGPHGNGAASFDNVWSNLGEALISSLARLAARRMRPIVSDFLPGLLQSTGNKTLIPEILNPAVSLAGSAARRMPTMVSDFLLGTGNKTLIPVSSHALGFMQSLLEVSLPVAIGIWGAYFTLSAFASRGTPNGLLPIQNGQLALMAKAMKEMAESMKEMQSHVGKEGLRYQNCKSSSRNEGFVDKVLVIILAAMILMVAVILAAMILMFVIILVAILMFK